MKAILLLLITPLLLIAKEPEQKQDLTKLKHPIAPMLWKVEGNDLKKPSYLFGSIHLADERVINLHPTAEKAFIESDTIATEIDLSVKNQLAQAQLMMRKDGKTLSQAIGPELDKELNAELAKINPILNSAPFQTFKTWAITVTLAALEDALKQKKPLDLVLYNRALELKKAPWSLETNEQQIGAFDTLTEEEHKILLKDTLRALDQARKNNKSIHDDLLNAYLSGSIEQIKQTTLNNSKKSSHPELEKKFLKKLLNDRNDHMTVSIEKKFKAEPNKTHFMIAGALHYVGANNVVDLLKKKGYTVTLQK